MPRTAPVPNIPAIPGMNPGVFVMGGGGGGGGGSGRGGSGSGGAQGADGENAGDDAAGGGANAGSCGPGSGAGCPNPSHGGSGTAAGDPVDVMTGRVFTIAATDLALPGPLPLVICRSYSTQHNWVDVGLGYGWSHSLAWRVEELRRSLRIHHPHAEATVARKPNVGQTLDLPCGKVTRLEHGYTIDAGDGMLRVFGRDPSNRRRYLLQRITDPRGNAIELTYANGRLEGVVDSVGRQVRVRYEPGGRITAFEVKNARTQGQWVYFRRYEYDDRGDLVAAFDAAGHPMRFEYEGDHLLSRKRFAGGLTTEHRYDAQERCIETWCHHPHDDGLDEDTSPTLADGTPAKGFLHHKLLFDDGFTEVVTSRGIRSYEHAAVGGATTAVWAGSVYAMEYDRAGRLTGYEDGEGAAWTFRRDERGRVVQVHDPMGGMTIDEHDDRGSVVSSIDPLGQQIHYTYDAVGNLLQIDDDEGMVLSKKYDERGLMIEATLPNGGVTRCTYDDLGNRTEIVEPDGTVRRVEYDFFGRPIVAIDARGFRWSFTYDDCGRLRSRTTPSGAVFHMGYDEDGQLTTLVDADGRTTRLERGGYHQVTALVRPSGSRVSYRYDREQELVRIRNERGEDHRLERDAGGRIVREDTFDGRTLHYAHDHNGRITSITYGLGAATAFRYDPLGRLVERTHTDGRVDRYEYDALGRLTMATNDDVTTLFRYDRRGNIVEETRRGRGGDEVIERTYDSMGRAVTCTFGGVHYELERDIMGRTTKVSRDGRVLLRIGSDALGFETKRVLPNGMVVLQEWDGDRRLTRTRVVAPAKAGASAGQPGWVGDPALGESGGVEMWSRAYTWSAGGDRLGFELNDGTRGAYQRDADGRVSEHRVTAPGGSLSVTEDYGYPAGAPQEGGAATVARQYGPGGRLLARQGVSYHYDDRGRLVTKRGPDGQTRYLWSDDGLLRAVHTPSGEQVAFYYDAFGRRVTKEVTGGDEIAVTRYLWDTEVPLRRERTRRTDAGDVHDHVDYLVIPGDTVPLAQARDGGEYEQVISDPNGFPVGLLGADVEEMAATIFGLTQGDAPTELRAPGQQYDSETGLHDNHFRHYDPVTGRYISPEPLGLMGGLDPYAYADSYPLELIDLDAQKKRMHSRVTRRDGTFVTGTSGGGDGRRGGLHPAVQSALPPSNARPEGQDIDPSNCAEPAALSAHIEDFEGRTGRSCRPGEPGWRENLGAAMAEIDPEGGIASRFGSGDPNDDAAWDGMDPRASCPNCSQTIPRMYRLGQQDPPGRVIAPGARADGSGPHRTTEPRQGFHTGENASAGPIVDNAGNPVQPQPHRPRPGTWDYDEDRERFRRRRR